MDAVYLSDIDKELLTYLNHEFKTPIFVMKALIKHILNDQIPSKDHLEEMLREIDKFEDLVGKVASSDSQDYTLDDLKKWKAEINQAQESH